MSDPRRKAIAVCSCTLLSIARPLEVLAMGSETALVRAVLQDVADLRRGGMQIKAIKIHGNQYTEAGTPDLHVTFEGRSYWMELKVGDNKPTAIQNQRLSEWREAGAIIAVVRSVAEFRRHLGLGN